MIKSWINSVSYAYWYNLEIVPIVSRIDYLGCDCCWFVICLLIWYYLMLIFTATALFWKNGTDWLSYWVSENVTPREAIASKKHTDALMYISSNKSLTGTHSTMQIKHIKRKL